MPSLLLLLALATLTWIARWAYKLRKNYLRAKCLGVPILVSPVEASNVLWIAFQDVLAPHIARLPFALGAWVRYNRRSWWWMFHDRGRIHQEYGPIIAHVQPTSIHVWITDKDVINELLKGKDRALFDKPRADVKVIDFRVPHLMSVCGDEWKRHRRIVASPFNQRSNRIVWTESLHQGLILGEHWLRSSSKTGAFRTMWKDNETATMNVMVSAGFGQPREHHGQFSARDQGDNNRSFSLHSSLFFMLHNFLLMIAIPSSLWFPKQLPPFPQGLRKFFIAMRAFKKHVEGMINDSKAAASKADIATATATTDSATTLRSDNLLSALVRHSEEMKQDSQRAPTAGRSYKDSLSDDEIVANLFGLAFAGHETTAHTLAYSLFLLAANPQIQEWVAEEIRQVLQESGENNVENLSLDETSPRLVRTRAVVYETLRLYTPLSNILKRSLSAHEETLHVGSRILRIPAQAYLLPALYALHASEEYWGSDSLEWKPQRWISIDIQGKEEFVQPSPAGTFLPWSDGPRSCPGARFAQTELTAVCTAFLAGFRVSVALLDGEDEETATGRVKSALENSTILFTLMIKEPEKLPLRIERRGTLS